MRDANLRLISDDERNALYGMMRDADDGGESGYRARIIPLKDEGYTVPEIRVATNHHDVNIRSTQENGYIDSMNKVSKE